MLVEAQTLGCDGREAREVFTPIKGELAASMAASAPAQVESAILAPFTSDAASWKGRHVVSVQQFDSAESLA